ncbi:SsrA-binding protein SmpB [Patescibacteria group bacterium]|nr:SsrA-binding protein SmpB [Patescibacteria group bacterium]
MVLAKNKKAIFDYEVLDKYVAGIALFGHEVKSVKEGNVNFEGSLVTVMNGEAYVVNLHIGRYSHQSQKYQEKEARRTRKLLLTKKEAAKLAQAISLKGRFAVPLALILQRNLVKLELAVVRSKKQFEKKQLLMERQLARDLDRARKDAS